MSNISTTIIIVDKTGVISQKKVKNLDMSELYKKCGFRKASGFEKRHTWVVKKSGIEYIVSVYARTEGLANTENKYDLPPPVDNELYFGKIALVRKDANGNIIDLTEEHWNIVYNKLFGGFEDLGLTAEMDEIEIDELATISPSRKTKSGYLKDGFVVQTDSEDSDEEYSYNGDKDDTELCDDGDDSDINNYIDDDEDDSSMSSEMGSELAEEEYMFSDDEM